MRRTNLLPWRDTLRKEREVRLSIITGMSLALVGVVVLLVHLYMNNEIAYQQQRNNYLNAEIKKADAKILEIKNLKQRKKRLLERMNVIQDLERSRSDIVHVFDELVKQIPGGVYFTTLIQKGNNIILEGVAQSEARVSSLMVNLANSEWLKDPKIDYIKTQKNLHDKRRSTSRLKVRFTQTAPKKEDES